MEYQASKPISLAGHPLYTEKWLQERIANDPSLLGLGDLVVKDVERRQPRAGRLDLLLSDVGADKPTRYEVELQLGATDETHIIRTVEYWDIERRRYPQYDHIAVIVAEDITSRFLNVLSLFNGFIPLIAIQLSALQVGDVLTLHTTRVMDVTTLGVDDDDEAVNASADRSYWESRGTPASLKIVDALWEMVRAHDPSLSLKYNKHYIGLARDGVADNFAAFRPRKEYVAVEFRIPRSDELTAQLEQSGVDVLDYQVRWGRYRLRLTASDLTRHSELIKGMIAKAHGTLPPEE
ncbi:hypothetical protein [Kineococcus glutinatus]|uniref:DUF5655 domain-containing protein n=1 Tax=Kineococcus glutinatus TaxID=1070872 RepID=A0ABP9H6G4_9ACTN